MARIFLRPFHTTIHSLLKSKMEDVFVYGTLKQGQHNHYLMLSDQEEEGEAIFRYKATTTTRYPLVIGGCCHVPYLLDSPARGEHVVGEVYSVDAAMLRRLDELEQHPVLYQRDKISVTAAQNTNGEIPDTNECWAYLLRNYPPDMDALPTLKCYGEQSTKDNYIPPRDRTPDMTKKQRESVKLDSN